MAKGGYREGSGRPVGTTGAYKTPEEKKKMDILRLNSLYRQLRLFFL